MSFTGETLVTIFKQPMKQIKDVMLNDIVQVEKNLWAVVTSVKKERVVNPQLCNIYGTLLQPYRAFKIMTNDEQWLLPVNHILPVIEHQITELYQIGFNTGSTIIVGKILVVPLNDSGSYESTVGTLTNRC
jgi:hypothetical protein